MSYKWRASSLMARTRENWLQGLLKVRVLGDLIPGSRSTDGISVWSSGLNSYTTVIVPVKNFAKVLNILWGWGWRMKGGKENIPLDQNLVLSITA